MELTVFIVSGILSLILWNIDPFLAGCIVSFTMFSAKLATGYYLSKRKTSMNQ